MVGTLSLASSKPHVPTSMGWIFIGHCGCETPLAISQEETETRGYLAPFQFTIEDGWMDGWIDE
jgi:hypothetical protein